MTIQKVSCYSVRCNSNISSLSGDNNSQMLVKMKIFLIRLTFFLEKLTEVKKYERKSYIFENLKEAFGVIKEHETNHTLRYSVYYTSKGFGTTGKT